TETMMSPPAARPTATDRTGRLWPVSVPMVWAPVAASHTRTVPSSPAETMMSRSAAWPVATACTGPVWPVSGSPVGSPVAASHTPPAVLASGADDVAACCPADRHRPPFVGVAGRRVAGRVAGGHVPHPHRAVAAGGDDDVAACGSADRHREHRAGVACQRTDG